MAQDLEEVQMDQVIRDAPSITKMKNGQMMATIRGISMLVIGKTCDQNTTLLLAMVTNTAIQMTRALRSFF